MVLLSAVAPVLSAVLWIAPARADQPRTAADWVNKGNARFREGRLIDALDAYRNADAARPNSPVVAFNRGLAHYRLGEYDKARERFNETLLAADRALEGRARFNLGNCAYAAAVDAQQDDPRRAIESLKQAVNYYCDSLDLLPDNAAAKANVQLARELLKQLQEQSEPQPQTQPHQSQENQDQRQQSDTQPAEQDQPSASQPSSSEEQGEERDQEQQQGEAGEPDERQAGQQPSETGQQDEPLEAEASKLKLTEEQAQRLLQAVRDKERARRLQKARQRQRLPAPDGKDW